MKPLMQEDNLGCAVACVAFVLGIEYKDALEMFPNGDKRVREKANFYCPEIVRILNVSNRTYKWKKIISANEKLFYEDFSIIFVEKSKKYPYGHFLCRYKNKWMDPWINLPQEKKRAGFRSYLPGKATYMIFKVY